jgi:hypothetical protein
VDGPSTAGCDHGPCVRSGEKGDKIAMDAIDLEDQIADSPTRRTIVKTGVKLAYVAPIVAASFKVSGVNAQTISPIKDNCFHSTGTNGGCMPACTSAGFTGAQCGPICGTGQFTGACPVGQGGGNPCCNPGYCVPANYSAGAGGNPVYTGPTAGCPPVTTTGKKKKK